MVLKNFIPCRVAGFRYGVNQISEDWQLVTDVSRQSIGPIFKDQGTLKKEPIDCPETSVTSCQCVLCDSQENEGLNIIFILASDLKSRICACKMCDVTS